MLAIINTLITAVGGPLTYTKKPTKTPQLYIEPL